MTIRLRFIGEHSTPNRIAERDFEWDESMGDELVLRNPADQKDILALDVDGIIKKNGKKIYLVTDPEGGPRNFTDILSYGFTEVICSRALTRKRNS